MELVPASTRIRSRSIPNVDTDRLRRRRDWLIAHKAELARAGQVKLTYADVLTIIEAAKEGRL